MSLRVPGTLVVGALLVGGARAEPAVAPVARLPASLQELGWLAGRWVGATEETWVAAGDVYVGVSFQDQDGAPTAFEVLFVEEREGAVRLVALPGGAARTEFPRVPGAGLVVENPTHDFPRRIAYTPTRRGLRARVSGGEGSAFALVWRRAPLVPAAEVMAADRAFAAEVAERGSAAWVEWFAPDGAQWGADARVPPGPEMAARMAPLLDGGPRLAWEPRYGGLAPAGDLAFTVGDWQWRTAEGVEEAHGAYVSVWQAQPGGGWKVLFDTGATATAPPDGRRTTDG